MASSFDGLGLSQLGSERRFMTGANPFSEALKGVKDFAILSAIDKSGLQGFLNEVGKNKQPAGSAAPDQSYAIKPIMAVDPNAASTPYMPAPALSPAPMGEGPSLMDQANEAMGLKTSSTFTGPNTFSPSPSATDTSMLSMASQPAPPPGNLNLPQYGKKEGGGFGQAILTKILPALFGIPA